MTATIAYKRKKRALPSENTNGMAGKVPGSEKTACWMCCAGDGGNKVNLSYRNIQIRNAEVTDAYLLCKWWNDGKVMAHAGFPLGLGINETEIISKIQAETDHTTRRHIILIDNVPVGEMNYRQLDDKTCEMGIKICETTHQNKGYGTIILSMFLHGLFHIRHYEKVLLDTNLNNKRAQHVYEKLGFTKVRVNVDAWKDQMGKLQSSIDYEMNKASFQCLYDFCREIKSRRKLTKENCGEIP